MREARRSPPAHRSARVIGTDALRILLVSPEPSDGQEHKQDTKDDPNINAHQSSPCRRLVPTQGADRVSAPTRRCRIDGPGLAITQVGWARHGQENYYAPTAGAEETGGRGLATTHTGKGCVMAN